jgi:hypothetical protein
MYQLKSTATDSILATAWPIWTILPEKPAASPFSGSYERQLGSELSGEKAMMRLVEAVHWIRVLNYMLSEQKDGFGPRLEN